MRTFAARASFAFSRANRSAFTAERANDLHANAAPHPILAAEAAATAATTILSRCCCFATQYCCSSKRLSRLRLSATVSTTLLSMSWIPGLSILTAEISVCTGFGNGDTNSAAGSGFRLAIAFWLLFDLIAETH